MITKEKYEQEHQLCPRCSSKQLNISTLGRVLNTKPYTDCRGVGCPHCGWKGIVDELCTIRPKDRVERIVSIAILITIIQFIILGGIVSYMVTH